MAQTVKSMTGFGTAAVTTPRGTVVVEIRSVNNKYMTLKNRLPNLLTNLESKIETIVRQRVTRGTVELFLRLDLQETTVTWSINEKLLKEYTKSAIKLGKQKGIDPAQPRAESLLNLPGVIESHESRKAPPQLERQALDTVSQAVENLLEARSAEGGRLAAIVLKRRQILEKSVERVAKRAPLAHRNNILRLKRRVVELLEGQKLASGDPTLQREIAFMADRSDITEELDRLRSHLKHFDKILESGGPMGRPLDFLIQEMGRELNTIGAKASDAQVSQHVVKAKAEMEKIREQVQNIE